AETADHGIAGGRFTLPKDLAVGPYQLLVHARNDAVQPVQLPFQVVAPKLPPGAAELELVRDFYEPGQTLAAHFGLSALPHQALGAQALGYSLALDGQVVARAKTQTTGAGTARIELPIPATTTAKTAALAVAYATADGTQTITRAVPLAGEEVQVDFF